jgi:CDP-diacylglycerol--glycerol-3-phosphate 3-phosphatidyltransferase
LTAAGPARTVRTPGRVIEGTAIDLYRVKPAVLRGLEPLLGRLERTAVSPDALTLAAVPIGALAGAAILVSPDVPIALLIVPAAVAIRLLLNLLDGALARRTGRTHPRGELYNELGDRCADALMLAPVAFVPGAYAPAVWLGVVFAVLASFTSVATRAAGGERSYRGILSKPGRLALLTGFAIAALIVGPAAWGPFGPLLALGSFLTLAERVVLATRALQ